MAASMWLVGPLCSSNDLFEINQAIGSVGVGEVRKRTLADRGPAAVSIWLMEAFSRTTTYSNRIKPSAAAGAGRQTAAAAAEGAAESMWQAGPLS